MAKPEHNTDLLESRVCVLHRGDTWASWSLWAILRNLDSTMEALENNHRRFYISSSPLTNLWKHFESAPQQKKMTLAKPPNHIGLAGCSWVTASKLPRDFQMKRPLCACKLLSWCVIGFNNCFLALHCCTMKILLYYTFFRECAALHSACRVGLLRANFQSHAFYGKCILHHAASH